jgi:hypothetical protein
MREESQFFHAFSMREEKPYFRSHFNIIASNFQNDVEQVHAEANFRKTLRSSLNVQKNENFFVPYSNGHNTAQVHTHVIFLKFHYFENVLIQVGAARRKVIRV